MTDLPSLDPNSPTFAADVEARLELWEEEYAIESFPAEHRSHLGASSIGEDCWRKLWYQFRWVKLHQAEGRMRRLWDRGHREEEIFEGFLRWAGFSVRNIDPKTDRQYVFSKVDGHYGGSTDGKLLIRWAYNYPIIAEYKTFKDDLFKKLKAEKVKASNPKYYAQMCSYGAEFEVKHALFYAVNKDTDELYRELVTLDWSYAKQLEKKASTIIYADTAPSKLNENAAFWKCKLCTFNGICHYAEPVEINCRSCANAKPGPNGSWLCNLYGAIPKDFIAKGCPQHKGIV